LLSRGGPRCHSEPPLLSFRAPPPVIPRSPPPVIPRSVATRNLLESCTVSRRIPNCRFLTAFGMTQEKAVRNDSGERDVPSSSPSCCPAAAPAFIPSSPSCHSEEPPSCHSEERSDEESPRILHRLPPYSQLQIPHYVRNDTGRRPFGMTARKGTFRAALHLVVPRRPPLSFRAPLLSFRAPPSCHSEPPPPVIPSPPLLSFRAPPPVIPRSVATRNLLESCTVSRRIPNCRFLTTFGMTQGEGRSE
jgi:hypothetical protein